MNVKKFLFQLKDWLSETKEEAQINKGEIYFILIGIDKYSHWDNLGYCKNESESFLKLWHTHSKSNIKRKNIYKLYDSAATKHNIIALLSSLSRTISFDDNVIIHFAGHEFTNYQVKFFMPADGTRNNIYSCVSSLTIKHYLKDIKCSNILMIGNTFDIDIDKNKKSHWDTILQHHDYENLDRENNVIYSQLISFLRRDEANRNKEIFFISRNELKSKLDKETVFGQWHTDDTALQNMITEHRDHIKRLIGRGEITEALDTIERVVSNNDPNLKSQVDTLKYKHEEVINYSANEIIKKEEKDITTSKITELSEGIVEKMDSCGFYLVHLPHKQNQFPLPDKEKNIILFTSADPSDQSRLRLNDEFRDIEFKLMCSKNRDLYDLVPCLATRISDFQRKLLEHKPQYIHFSGHGTCKGICLIGNEDGETTIVENKPLAELFRIFSPYIKCVFLNSCHSIGQSKPIAKHIKNVVCMNNTVNDKTAIHFASAFYEALASGQDISFSFDFAKNSIDLHKLTGSDIPQLLVNHT